MSTSQVTPAPDQTKPAEKQPTTDPYELLKEVGGPSREQIEFLKQQSPNGRVRLLTPDHKRVFVLRGTRCFAAGRKISLARASRTADAASGSDESVGCSD